MKENKADPIIRERNDATDKPKAPLTKVSEHENPRDPLRAKRDFLAKLGLGMTGAAGMALAVTGKSNPAAAAVKSAAKHKTQYAMIIDTRRCIGCHACTVACKSENDVPLGENRCWVEYTEKGSFPNVDRSFLPRLCNHCSKPACVDVCPTGATYKREDDGIVVVDTEVCIGCKYCVQACPYDARYLNPVTGSVDKCDFCFHRVSQGLVPSCVNTCQGRARIFGDINDPDSEVSQLLAKNAYSVLQKGMGTEPNVYYIDADHSDPRDALYKDRYIRVQTHRKEEERR
ncbi:Tetrathionate reductase subunit B [hydrothermal vent metagenome]|uniref:Tetrathionate reductase subunit B n=1 Tax=hydrothermal vent metagenome TaxID=652676 RepID=A0A3B0SG01_9ZZZZ